MPPMAPTRPVGLIFPVPATCWPAFCFQAVDVIRDGRVTGVQTCALPISIGVGLAVTLLAGVLPAVRASRVAPLAALRDVASEPPAGSRLRVLAGAVLAAGGVAATLVGVLGGGDATTLLTATGAVLLLFGVVVLGPAVARPASRLIGAPL